MSPEQAAETFVYRKLSNESALESYGFHNESIPQDSGLPAIYYVFIDSSPVKNGMRDIGATMVMMEVLCQSAGLNYPDTEESLMESVLHNSSGDVNGEFEINCVKERGIRRSHELEGDQYRDAGARYSILVRPLP